MNEVVERFREFLKDEQVKLLRMEGEYEKLHYNITRGFLSLIDHFLDKLEELITEHEHEQRQHHRNNLKRINTSRKH